MEAQNGPNHQRHEPGRRYAAGRVRPRAGADVHRVAHPPAPHQPVVPEATPAPKPQPKPDVARPKDTKPHTRKPSTAKPALPRTTRSAVLRRQMVEHAKEHKKKVKRNHRKHLVLFIILGVIAVSIGVIVWSFQDVLPFNVHFFQKGSQQPSKDERADTNPSSRLDETAINSEMIATYKMAPDAPRILRIPKIEVEARVMRVGVTLGGEPVAPSNIFDVGWFEQNGKPNEPGAVLINGHTYGPTKEGVFVDLKSLVLGDSIQLELGSGTVITYIVDRVQEYPFDQIDMSVATASIDPAKQGLNLMTTSNRYSNRSSTPGKQLIVFTTRQ